MERMQEDRMSGRVARVKDGWKERKKAGWIDGKQVWLEGKQKIR